MRRLRSPFDKERDWFNSARPQRVHHAETLPPQCLSGRWLAGAVARTKKFQTRSARRRRDRLQIVGRRRPLDDTRLLEVPYVDVEVVSRLSRIRRDDLQIVPDPERNESIARSHARMHAADAGLDAGALLDQIGRA